MEWHKGEVTILIRLPGVERVGIKMVPALLSGPWAVHRTSFYAQGPESEEKCSLTHVPTGLAVPVKVGHFSQESLQEQAEALSSLDIDWGAIRSPEDYKGLPVDKRNKVRAVLGLGPEIGVGGPSEIRPANTRE